MAILIDKKIKIERKFIQFFLVFNYVGLILSVCFITIVIIIMTLYDQVILPDIPGIIFSVIFFPLFGGAIVSFLLWITKELIISLAKRTSNIVSMPMATFLLLLFTFLFWGVSGFYKAGPVLFLICLIYSIVPMIINAFILLNNRKTKI